MAPEKELLYGQRVTQTVGAVEHVNVYLVRGGGYWRCCGKRKWTVSTQEALNAETGASLHREAEEWP